jgi:hypothetical protein
MKGPKDKAGFWIAFAILVVALAVVIAGTYGAWLTGSANGVFVLAALLVIALLVAVEAIARWNGKSFAATVILGKDGRTSTSKTFVLLWTLLVGWALVALLVAGEALPAESCVSTSHCSTGTIGLLQLGWHTFLTSGLDGAYLVLLGIPASAAVAAKAVTQQKVDSGSNPVVPVTAADTTLAARVGQIFSADDGSTDIGDFQYVIFNLILAAYFTWQFLNLVSPGLPPIPDTLLGLTSVSAALYVGKKAASRTQPTISGVFPSYLLPNGKITITGQDLTDDPSPGAARKAPQVAINGRAADNVQADPSIADRITADVPPGLNGTTNPVSGSVEVLSSLGFKTQPYTVTLGPSSASAQSAESGSE